MVAKSFLDFTGLTTYNDKIKEEYLAIKNKDSELSEYVKSAALDSKLESYAQTSAISDMLTKTEAESTYAKETSISDMLTKSEANTIYVKTESLTSQLESQKTQIESEIDSKLSTVYKPQGSETFESLTRPLTKDMLGYVYNVSNAFTTDENFIEGAGHTHPAGTNIVVVSDSLDSYKYDVLSGVVDLSGYVKESEITAIGNDQIEGLFSD